MKRLAATHAEIEIALARAERVPDLDLGVVAGKTMPGDMPYVGGMPMATVPLWHADKPDALYRGGLQVQARQAFRVSLASYQTDQTGFLMVLDAPMALYDAERAEAMAQTERRQMAAMALALAGHTPDEGSTP